MEETSKILTPAEFESEIDRIIVTYSGDEEIMHIRLDEACWELLRTLGYVASVNKIKHQEKWYA